MQNHKCTIIDDQIHNPMHDHTFAGKLYWFLQPPPFSGDDFGMLPYTKSELKSHPHVRWAIPSSWWLNHVTQCLMVHSDHSSPRELLWAPAKGLLRWEIMALCHGRVGTPQRVGHGERPAWGFHWVEGHRTFFQGTPLYDVSDCIYRNW